MGNELNITKWTNNIISNITGFIKIIYIIFSFKYFIKYKKKTHTVFVLTDCYAQHVLLFWEREKEKEKIAIIKYLNMILVNNN